MHSDGGPGNMHLINGLYDSHRNRVPVLAIAAQVPSRELGSAYFQETRPDILFKDCSHYCEPISSAAQMPRVYGLAIQAAYGTTLDNPDFAKMAETIGIRGIRVEDPSEVPAAIQAAFAHEGPVLIDAVANRQSFRCRPRSNSIRQGFSLYMLKAVIRTLERFQGKWTPLSRPKMRQIK